MMNINKKSLSEKLAEQRGLTKKESSEIIDDLFKLIKEELREGNKVEITGFGKFEVKKRAPRKGINPQTKEPIDIKATNVLSFKASKSLKENVR